MVSGDFDLLVEVMCKDRDHLATFLNEKLLRVPGITNSQTSMVLHTYKMAYGALPSLGGVLEDSAPGINDHNVSRESHQENS